MQASSVHFGNNTDKLLANRQVRSFTISWKWRDSYSWYVWQWSNAPKRQQFFTFTLQWIHTLLSSL